MIRVVLPQHLRTLAKVDREISVEVEGPVTQRSVIDAIEAQYPVLIDRIRDRGTKKRRPLVRFFACQEDLSNAELDDPLPEAVLGLDLPGSQTPWTPS